MYACGWLTYAIFELCLFGYISVFHRCNYLTLRIFFVTESYISGVVLLCRELEM